MKKILYIFSAIAIMLSYACEPQKDVAPDFGAMPTGDFSIDNSDPNNLVFKATANDAFMYNWNFGNGITSQDKEVTVYYPFKGDYTVTLTLTGNGGKTEVTKKVTVSTDDPEVGQKPGLKELTGGGAGKTWEYNPAGNGYCFMTANYDWEEFWWNPYADSPSPERDAKMKFELDGGYVYTYIAPDGTETKGSFILDMDNMTLKIIDTQIPDQYEENCDPDVTSTGIYQVKILKDRSLLLWQDQSAANPDKFDYGWTWKFKEDGYTPPAPTGDFTYSISGNTVTYTATYDANTNSVSWDLGNGGEDVGEEVEAFYPFAGDYDIIMTLHGDGGDVQITKTITITADDADYKLQDGFKQLTNSGTGRVWAFDLTNSNGYSYMTAPDNYEDIWWNPYDTDPANEASYTMEFNLNGARNFILRDGSGAEVVSGEFELDVENNTLKIIPVLDAHIPNQYEPECDISVTSYGLFDIKVLDDNSLILFMDQTKYHPNDYDFGWTWVFISQ